MTTPAADLPAVSKSFSWCFGQFLPRYVARNFHSVSLLRRGGRSCPQVEDGVPLVVVLNHPSWWDPLMGLLLAKHCTPARRFRAPIEGAMLQRYRIFASLGFFGVDKNASGLRQFLRTSRAILESPLDALWITPEGRFADVRDDAEFEPGVGHIAASMDQGLIIPLAAEYPFWEERKPEALAAFGDAIDVSDFPDRSKSEWSELIRSRLRATQAELAEASLARDPEAFDPVLAGTAGVGGFYDLGRRLSAWSRFRQFRPEHGEKLHHGG